MSFKDNEVKNISPQQLQELLCQPLPPLILDVREDEELKICALADAIHIPLGELANSLEALPQSRLIVTVCHHGRRSLQAACLLKRQGFAQVLNLEGGIHAWACQVDPAMRQY